MTDEHPPPLQFRPDGCAYCEQRDQMMDLILYAIDHHGSLWLDFMSDEVIRNLRLHVEEWHRRRHA